MEALLFSILVCENIFKNNSVPKIVNKNIENKNHEILVRTDFAIFTKSQKYENSLKNSYLS